jgi:parvulin-like peptidyl-prolyl isomerase
LGVGERSGVIKGEGGYFVIESLGRKLADSTAWFAQRTAQREQLRQAALQARMQQYMEGLRAKAKIVDRRKQLFKAQAATDAATS